VELDVSIDLVPAKNQAKGQHSPKGGASELRRDLAFLGRSPIRKIERRQAAFCGYSTEYMVFSWFVRAATAFSAAGMLPFRRSPPEYVVHEYS